MITLFKLAFDLFIASAIFVGGVKVGVKYPNIAAKISSLISFAKKVA